MREGLSDAIVWALHELGGRALPKNVKTKIIDGLNVADSFVKRQYIGISKTRTLNNRFYECTRMYLIKDKLIERIDGKWCLTEKAKHLKISKEEAQQKLKTWINTFESKHSA